MGTESEAIALIASPLSRTIESQSEADPSANHDRERPA